MIKTIREIISFYYDFNKKKYISKYVKTLLNENQFSYQNEKKINLFFLYYDD